MSQIPGKQIKDEAIDSQHYVDGSIDAEHLSTGAKAAVLEYKLLAAQVQVSDIATAAASTLTTDAMMKKIFDASASKKVGGSSSLEAVVTTAPNNVMNLRDSTTNDPIEDGSQRQVYARLTGAVTALTAAVYTWAGTTTVSPDADPNGELAVGEFIKLDADGQYFEVSAIGAGPAFAITILNPGSLVIPSGAGGSSKYDFTMSFYVDIAGTETAHTMASEVVDAKFRESFDLDSMPFASLAGGQYGEFLEVLPADSYVDIGSGNPNTTSGGSRVGTDSSALGSAGGLLAAAPDTIQGALEAVVARIDDFTDIGSGNPNTTAGASFIGTDASAIGGDAGSTDTVQGVLEAYQSAIDTIQTAISGTAHKQESVTTQVITGTDTALTDTLDFAPVSASSVKLYLNGVLQKQGATFDYTISGSTITWLQSTGTAVPLDTSDELLAVYNV